MCQVGCLISLIISLYLVHYIVKLNSCVVLGTKRKKEGYDKEMLYARINEVLRSYNHMDVYIKTIHVDSEFRSVLNELLDKWDVEINFFNPGEHVPDIEWENRTQQERFRVNLYWLPYEIIQRNI